MKVISRSDVPKLCEAEFVLPQKNLLVGGCSFTSFNFGNKQEYFDILKQNYENIRGDSHWPNIATAEDWDNLPEIIKNECEQKGCNWKELTYVTWPVYTRDLLGMSDIYDCSCPGAGNKHIHDSVMYALETNINLTPANTFIVIMWSGYGRDDVMIDKSWLKSDSPCRYDYTGEVSLGLTGGILGQGNLLCSLDVLKRVKSNKSRAIENFLLILSLKSYLQKRGFEFVFTEFSSDLKEYEISVKENLDSLLINKWQDLIGDIETLGEYAWETVDGSHPSPKCHWAWSKNILIPRILKTLKKELK